MSTKLTKAATNLVWAKVGQDTQSRMSALAEALEEADCKDCGEAREVLLHKLREELPDRAGDACAAAPNLFPARMPHLLTLLPTLKSGKLEHLCASPEREHELKAWQQNHPCKFRRADFGGARYAGSFGGADTFCFTPLSIGSAIVKVRCACGAELDLTESMLG